MKYYETNCSEYIAASKRFDMHPELRPHSLTMPDSLSKLGNIIFYGPSGVGKYTQFLRFIEKYSTNGLKTEKMTASTEKQHYEYHISDIHYEIDLALLGCESKKLWNECFFQIVDIVSAKKSKCGIILCRNFQSIHSELLDVFYSYMQQCRALSIHIVFAILTEHVSFIPNRILQCCKMISVRRPTAELYNGRDADFKENEIADGHKTHKQFSHQILPTNKKNVQGPMDLFLRVGTIPERGTNLGIGRLSGEKEVCRNNGKNTRLETGSVRGFSDETSMGFSSQNQTEKRMSESSSDNRINTHNCTIGTIPERGTNVGIGRLSGEKEVCRNNGRWMRSAGETEVCRNNAKHTNTNIVPESLLNMKELNVIARVDNPPKDVFNIICDNIISKMVQHETLDIIVLRDNLYDILLYGLDITECLWYILYYFVETDIFVDETGEVMSEIMDKIDSFLKYYNNNYRPIYHLESIFIYLITKIYRYPSLFV